MKSAVPLVLLFVVGCTQRDVGTVCANGDQELELTVWSDLSCSADHRGAKLTCSVARDGSKLVVTTAYRSGRPTPQKDCSGRFTGTCSLPLEPGDYTLEFAGESYPLTFPLEERLCVPAELDSGF